MADDYRLSRHVQIWDQQNKTMKRVALAALVFSSFMLVNILRPYSEDFEESREKRDSIVETKRNMQQTKESLRQVRDFEEVVSDTRATVERAPWQSHKVELIDSFRRMQADQPGPQEEYQQLADQAVRNIAKDVRQAMLPLQDAANANSGLRMDIPDIQVATNEVVRSIDNWEESTLGKRWYGTIPEKDYELRILNRNVEGELQSVAGRVTNSIDTLSAEIQVAQEELAEEYRLLEQEDEQKSKVLEELEEEMQSVLPRWVRGLIGVEDMVQLFPFIVLGIAFYLLFSAIKLTGNYKWIAARRNWSPQEQNDPLYSSSWTLIYRGPLGTATTGGLYVIVFALSWFFAREGGNILLEWIDAGHDSEFSKSNFETMLYATKVLLIFGLAFILFKTLKDIYLRQKQGPE